MPRPINAQTDFLPLSGLPPCHQLNKKNITFLGTNIFFVRLMRLSCSKPTLWKKLFCGIVFKSWLRYLLISIETIPHFHNISIAYYPFFQ